MTKFMDHGGADFESLKLSYGALLELFILQVGKDSNQPFLDFSRLVLKAPL
jgi:hypothetical protein